MTAQPMIKCEECNGSGAAKPDCWLCKGNRHIHANKAYRHRFKKSELQDLEDDGYCDCPVCDGDFCSTCQGDCEVRQIVHDQQIDRVILFGANSRGRIPYLFDIDHRGRVCRSDPYLAHWAAVEARKRGWISWFCSVFGDEIYLTDEGEKQVAEARARYLIWLRRYARQCVEDRRNREAWRLTPQGIAWKAEHVRRWRAYREGTS